MPTLGLVVPSLEKGGGVPSVAKFVLAAAQRDGRYRVKLISLATSSSDDCSTRLARPMTLVKGVSVREAIWQDLPMYHVGASLTDFEFQRYRPRRKLKELVADCDVIQVVCGSPAWANAVVGMGKPVALQVATLVNVERRRRDASPRTLSDWWRKGMTSITNRLDVRGLKYVDAVQLENPWMLDFTRDLNKGREDIDIRYAPPGVDESLFCPGEARGLEKNQYILCVGRLDDPRKNIELLLEAFCALPKSLEHVKLVTAGSGRPPPEYWERVKERGVEHRVSHVLRPSTDELVRLYQNATVFALASDEEGLGVVILEAMACAVPVVATRCGGPDGIITDGFDGFLVPLDDAESMKEAIARLCSHRELNIEMGKNARNTIESRYAKDVTGRVFVEMWDRLTSRSPR